MKEPNFYIVFDLERNFRPYQSDAPSEIVDIGAIKIEAASMRVTDRFSSFVRPLAPLSRHTTKLTGITWDDVRHAERFPKVFKKFQRFLGENYTLVTWGKEDYEFLAHDCAMHQLTCLPTDKSIRFDLQRFVFHAYETLFLHQPSLKLAVEQMGLTWEGTQHRAYGDAQNTASLLIKAAKEKGLYNTYNRALPFAFIENEKLTEKAKRSLRRWILKAYKRSNETMGTWEMFLGSTTWETVTEQYAFDQPTLLAFETYFDKALNKAKEQIAALAAEEDNTSQS